MIHIQKALERETSQYKKCLLIIRSMLYSPIGMPKREVREEKPRKRLGKKELLMRV
jgi:hypothetical protein